MSIVLAPLQEAVVSQLDHFRLGLTARELAKEIGVSAGSLFNCLRPLLDNQMVQQRQVGRDCVYYRSTVSKRNQPRPMAPTHAVLFHGKLELSWGTEKVQLGFKNLPSLHRFVRDLDQANGHNT